MTRALQLAHLAAALAVAAFFSVAAYVAWSARSIPVHVNGVLTRAEGVESKLNASAQNLDKATAAWSASAKAQADAVTDLTTDAHGTLSEAAGALDGIQTTVGKLGGTADALTGEITALRATTETIPPLVGDVRVAVQGISPLETSLTGASAHLDSILTSKGLGDTIDGLGKTSTNLAATTGDFQARFHAILYPPPCKTFGCKMARYVWPVLKDGVSLGDAAYWTHALFTDQKP